MIKDNPDFKWFVTNFDCNKQKIEKYNILRYREDDIKKLKKKYPTKEEFKDKLRTRCMSRFWSRAEYELIIFTEDDHIYLKPWVGCRDDYYKIDVTDETDFDWKGFAKKHINPKYGPEEKIDVWDQLEYCWSDFVDYVWNYHHKWQRKKKEV